MLPYITDYRETLLLIVVALDLVATHIFSLALLYREFEKPQSFQVFIDLPFFIKVYESMFWGRD
jgi:hypothetical protein